MRDNSFVGVCHAWRCPLGYLPEKDDLLKYGVIEDGDEDDEDDYIVVTDPDTIAKLHAKGIKKEAARTMQQAEEWESPL